MNLNSSERNRIANENDGEQGFMLVGLIVAIFLILLALSVAAPKVAQELRREKEVEAIHRGNQYVRAIRLYYKKTGMYPGSIEQLEKTNNIRYLRQRYVNPITGKSDWRLIHVGEAKTTVKGFFGQPLAGLTAGLGTAARMVSPGPGGAGAGSSTPSTSAFGSPGTSGLGSSLGSGGLGSSSGSSAFGSPGTSGLGSSLGSGGLGSSSGSSAFGSPGTSGLTSGTSGSNASSTGSGGTNTLGSAAGMASSQSGTGMPSGGAPFVGVGIPKEGSSITVLNEQTTYNTWEFIYDPRIEQLYAKGALFGGGSSSNLGSAGGMGSGTGGANSGFGNTTPGFGSTPGTSTPTTPTTPPQQ